jgi:proline dehydrogenase
VPDATTEFRPIGAIQATSVFSLVAVLPTMIPPIASRFIAGETTAEALEHARRCNQDDLGVILNLLGEHYSDPEDATADAAAYRQLIDDIAGSGLRACISIKPSQLGLAIDEATFRENYRELVTVATEQDVFVWCDMEDASTTEATLSVFEDVANDVGGGVGLCVQANLRRTRQDLERLAALPGKVRLVKGAYDEPPELAYRERSRVNRAYREDLTYMFEAFDDGIAVGSHDPAMLDLAERLHDEYGTDYEIQMLMGVSPDTQRELAATDHDVWQYAPYGGKWISYTYRRVRERRENLLFAARAILGR